MALMVDERIAEADRIFRKRSQLAKERLALLAPHDLGLKHRAFILACGGSQKKRNKKRIRRYR